MSGVGVVDLEGVGTILPVASIVLHTGWGTYFYLVPLDTSCGNSAHVRTRTNGRDEKVPVKCIFTGIIRIFYVLRASFVRM